MTDSPDESENSKNDVNGIDLNDFPTLSTTLSEARERYNEEESRREAVESKIGIVITVDALIISLASIFQNISGLVVGLLLLPALASAGLGLYGIKSREYNNPGKDIGDFYQYSKMGEKEQKDQLLLDYITSTTKNRERNNNKYCIFNICITMTFISLLAIYVAAVIGHLNIDLSGVTFSYLVSRLE